MSTGNTTVPSEREAHESAAVPEEEKVHPALVIADATHEPGRIGEVAMLADGFTVGRDDDVLSGTFMARDTAHQTGGLVGPSISRRQLAFHFEKGDSVIVENIGNAELVINGRLRLERNQRAPLRLYDVLQIPGHYALLFTRRPRDLPKLTFWPFDMHPFGAADPLGSVGESTIAWNTRETIAKAAQTGYHIFLHGESGVGKELAARGIHMMSDRSRGPFVACNASAFSPYLIDGELSGNKKNYPNGMAENPGLFGAADGGTFFLDEIGDMSRENQHRLLRALDGEYRRLGENFSRKCNFRCIGATNSDVDQLEPDLYARLKLPIELPSLNDRREDIPLLIRHMILSAARDNPRVAGVFVRESPGTQTTAAVDPAFVILLMRHQYQTNVRELETFIARAILYSKGNVVVAPPDVTFRELKGEVTREEALAAVQRANGNLTHAAKQLGITRWSLTQLLRKV